MDFIGTGSVYKLAVSVSDLFPWIVIAGADNGPGQGCDRGVTNYSGNGHLIRSWDYNINVE